MSQQPSSEGREVWGAPPRRFRDPGNGWVTPREKFVLGTFAFTLLIVVIVGAGFASWAATSIEETQDDVAENRAVGCQLLVALAQPLPDSCRDPEVLSYYDPNADPTPTRTTGLICDIGREVGVPLKDLPPICAEVDGDE